MAGDFYAPIESNVAPLERTHGTSKRESPSPRAHVYSVRLFKPFIRLLDRDSLIPEEWARGIRSLNAEERIPAATAHQLMEGILSLGIGPDIGLRAAREWSPGDGGALDYVVTSAATVRDAIEAAKRYMRLVNDVVVLELVVSQREAAIRTENLLPLPRPLLDFQLGALFRLLRCVWASGVVTRVHVPVPAPADRSEYVSTFDGAEIIFDATFAGFTFDAKHLDNELTSADFRLHDTIRLYAEQMLQEMPRAQSLTGWIESAIASELPKGAPTVNVIATRLRMSTRTLERRLEREGTTFSDLLEDLRRRLALRYVANRGIPLGEIAFLLGFSHTTGFHRAFKRWTGETPLTYRRGHMARASTEPA